MQHWQANDWKQRVQDKTDRHTFSYADPKL